MSSQSVNEALSLAWKRPDSVEFPKIWRTFKAKDIGSDELVDYYVQDLPESRFEDALDFMVPILSKQEPLCEAYEIWNDADAVESLRLLYKIKIEQKMSLVCFKADSDEIAGINVTCVHSKEDANFLKKYLEQVKCENIHHRAKILYLLTESFNIFENYGVDKFMTSTGFAVAEKYRGRRIGEEILLSRKPICDEFGIKVTSTVFTSMFSSRIADKAGYTTDNSIRYDDIRKIYPNFKLPPIKSDAMVLKTLVF